VAKGSPGIRFIDGKEFMLSGRFDTKEDAEQEARELRREWNIVKVRMIRHVLGCYSCWVHDAKPDVSS